MFLLLFLSACREETLVKYECDVVENPIFVDSYFNFKVGTYWVYQELTSHALDTLSVYYHSGTILPSKNDFFWLARSSRRGFNYYQSYYECVHLETNNTPSGCYRNCVVSGYENSLSKGSSGTFLVEGRINERVENANSFLMDELDSYIVSDLNYSRILKYKIKNDPCYGNDSMIYFLADHFGIIQMQNLSSGEVWNLVESNIVK